MTGEWAWLDGRYIPEPSVRAFEIELRAEGSLNQRASYSTERKLSLERKALDMRAAIDAMELSLMGFGDLVNLPELFETTGEDVVLNVKVTVGDMRRVCKALEELTRIMNSEEYFLKGATDRRATRKK